MPEIIVVPDGASRFLNEAQLVQNVALGATLVWRFVASYDQAGKAACPLPLCFAVLPILFHHVTRDAAFSTNPGSPLAKFVEKFDQKREDLLAIHERMLAMRALSLRSIQLAAERWLIAVEPAHGIVMASPKVKLSTERRPEALRPMLRAAEKLGGWCAAYDLAHIANQLRLFF
jgi:hypothetical protein